jgi:hypothetical protein
MELSKRDHTASVEAAFAPVHGRNRLEIAKEKNEQINKYLPETGACSQPVKTNMFRGSLPGFESLTEPVTRLFKKQPGAWKLPPRLKLCNNWLRSGTCPVAKAGFEPVHRSQKIYWVMGGHEVVSNCWIYAPGKNVSEV